MILAALGDIHGNWPALQSVLAAIDSEGIQTIVNTGDCVVGHPWSNPVVECLRERNIPTACGENDRLAARFLRRRRSLQKRLPPKDFAAIEEAFEQCSSENLEYLRALPVFQNLTVDGLTIAVCHGLLSGAKDALRQDDPLHKYQRQRELLPADIMVMGRTHQGFSKPLEGTLFVNPGSVGAEPGKASYTLISTEVEPWTAELLAVDY